MVQFKRKDKYDINDLLEIMRLLRSPDGCPWDKEQTNSSIRGNVLEEAYEVADAIDCNDDSALCEELGDLLLQVVFHCEIAAGTDRFDFCDVTDGICKKLILRHPHIFADGTASTADEVLDTWDEIKKKEKLQETATDTLKSVPKAFPALMRAQKVQKRAAKASFDWDDAEGAWDKIAEEANELKQAVASGEQSAVADELGDLLFSVVNVSRFLGVDSEQALAAATDKFIKRFECVEQLANKSGIDMKHAPLSQLDKLWETAKSDS